MLAATQSVGAEWTNDGVRVFTLAPDGKILTNQAEPDSSPLAGSITHKWPVYDTAGNLIGYLPIMDIQ